MVNNKVKNGSVIYVSGVNLLLIDNIVSNNDVDSAVLLYANATVDNCIFINNTINSKVTDNCGGAIQAMANVNILNSYFKNNVAKYGGAVFLGQGGNIDNCIFEYNMAKSNDDTGYGGAVFFYNGTGNITNSEFYNNIALDYGGAVYLSFTTRDIIMDNCTFANNTAKNGIIAWAASESKLTNSQILDNFADGFNIISIYGDNNSIENSIISNNFANGEEVTIIGVSAVNTTIKNCTLSENSVMNGNGIICFYEENGSVIDSYLSNNNATGFGSIAFSGANGKVINCTLSNDKESTGNSIFIFAPNCYVADNTFDNCVGMMGDSIVITGSVTLDNNDLDEGIIYVMDNFGGAILSPTAFITESKEVTRFDNVTTNSSLYDTTGKNGYIIHNNNGVNLVVNGTSYSPVNETYYNYTIDSNNLAPKFYYFTSNLNESN